MILVIIAACNAPHNNPLDPESPDYSTYIIEGKVQSDSKTPVPLEKVSILWKNDNFSVFSDNSGNFKIKCSSRQDGWLVYDKESFAKDSTFLSFKDQNKITVQLRLNSIPVLDSIFIYSVVRNKYSFPEYQLNADVTVEDVDDDIDSVYLVCNALSISKPLQKIRSQYFEGRFYDYELNIASLDLVIGKEFQIKTVSSTGKQYTMGNAYVKRIIKEEIETISPKNSDTLTNPTPTLNWKRFEPGFDFDYSLEIYTDETEPKLQWRKENISKDEIFYTVETAITFTSTNNKFFWVVWAVDEFKNRTRSKPAGFILTTKH
jgi:hypothetical protein